MALGAVLAVLALTLLAAGTASADLASLKAACQTRDAADGTVANGNQLPYRFCDDGVPDQGGVTPNVGAVKAVAVPAKYDGHLGLPAQAADAATQPGADPATGKIALDVDVSLPDTTAYPLAGGNYPVVVMMHGCCSGSKTSWAGNRIDEPGEKWHYNSAWFAARGYVVLTYTARGFVNASNRGSTGQTQLDDRRFEINDYQYLAGLVADDAFFNADPAKVVPTGGSYGGGFSWLALTDPTWKSPGNLDMKTAAAAPKYGWTDLVQSLVPNGNDRRDELPAPDGSSSINPQGFPKRTSVGALYTSGKTGIPPGTAHTTFAPNIDSALLCLQSTDPYQSNPLCSSTLSDTIVSFRVDKSAYTQSQWFQRIEAAEADAIVPLFSAGTLTDPLFPPEEHRRMVERIRSIKADYPVQEYYGDYNHFVQDKAKEYGDVCGADRHVCRYADYPGGTVSALNTDPSELKSTGVNTRLNRFIDRYARPPGNAGQATPDFDVTAATQICPENASPQLPADEPGERFTAPTFAALAPATLTVEATGLQETTNRAQPNTHAAQTEPVQNFIANGGKCPKHQGPPGVATAGPGVATYDSAPIPGDRIMVGRTRVTVQHTGAAVGALQLNARMYDLFPNGQQVMIDRGVKTLTSPNGPTVLDLHGNGWRLPDGHRIRIELAQDDDPYINASNQPSALQLTAVRLQVPIRCPSGETSCPDAASNPTIGGSAAPSSLPDGGVPGSAPGVGAAAGLPDGDAPVITGAGAERRVFRRTLETTAETAQRRRRTRAGKGTAFRYRISEAAIVRYDIERLVRTRRKGRRCPKPAATAKRRRTKRCSRYRVVGRLTRAVQAGDVRTPFSGRLGSRVLRPGRYRAVLRGTDAAGNVSAPSSVGFRVVP